MDKTITQPPPPPSSSASSSATAGAAPNDRPFLKKGSEKAFKLAATITAEEEPLSLKANISRFRDKSNTDSHHKSEHDHQQLHQNQPTEIENEEEVVLPPPMKPIQDSQAIINNGPTVVASSVVEQSPCKRVSIHINHTPTTIPNYCSSNAKTLDFSILYYWTIFLWTWAKSLKIGMYCILFLISAIHHISTCWRWGYLSKYFSYETFCPLEQSLFKTIPQAIICSLNGIYIHFTWKSPHLNFHWLFFFYCRTEMINDNFSVSILYFAIFVVVL